MHYQFPKHRKGRFFGALLCSFFHFININFYLGNSKYLAAWVERERGEGNNSLLCFCLFRQKAINDILLFEFCVSLQYSSSIHINIKNICDSNHSPIINKYSKFLSMLCLDVERPEEFWLVS